MQTKPLTACLAMLMNVIGLVGCSKDAANPVEVATATPAANKEMSVTYLKHLSDFGGLAWSVAFVEADFDSTLREYTRVVGGPLNFGTWTQDTGELFDPSGTVVEMSDCNWTAIFHSVGRDVPLDCEALAKSLDCRVLQYAANDTAGVTHVELHFHDGRSTRYMDPSDVENENNLNEDMGLPAVTGYQSIESHEDLLADLGILTITVSNAGDGLFHVPLSQSEKVGRIAWTEDVPIR